MNLTHAIAFKIGERILDKEQIREVIIQPYRPILESLERVIIFGAGRLGVRCARCLMESGIRVLGFLDNNRHGTTLLGVPVYRVEEYGEIGGDTLIVIASLNYWHDFEDQLHALGISNFMHYEILHAWDASAYSASHICFDGIIEDAADCQENYKKVRDLLSDERSGWVLDDLLAFRTTFDTKYTRHAYNISAMSGDQYFDSEIIPFSNAEIFIDGGAYQGETTVELMEKLKSCGKSFRRVFVVEPDGELLRCAKKMIGTRECVTFYEFGLSDRKERLRFCTTGDMGGAFDPAGESEIQLDTIDNLTQCGATFIKLDVEGFEEKALLGASETIKANKPKIAVSAYHKPGDIWRICEVVNRIRGDYKIFLRHYTPSCFETVFTLFNMDEEGLATP